VDDHIGWIIFGVLFVGALLLAAFIQIVKGDRFHGLTFVGRFFMSLAIVVVAAPLLFLGWCFCAMGNIGCINC
jgi:hypothetical protein